MKNIERRQGVEKKSAVAVRRPRLAREIAIALAIKVVVLFGLWLAFFSQPQVPKMTAGMAPDRVAAALMPPGATSPPPPRREPSHDH